MNASALVLMKNFSADDIRSFSSDAKEPAWLLEIRLAAWKNFENLPWPTDKDERWKRTEIDKNHWDNQPVAFGEKAVALEIPEALKEQGVQWLPLSEAVASDSQRLKTAWKEAVARAEKDKFLSLTLALGNRGGALVVPKGVVIKSPLQLPTPNAWRQTTGLIFPLTFVFLEEAAEVYLWEELSQDDAKAAPFVLSYTMMELKENAKAVVTYLQHWNNDTWHFQFQDIIQRAFSRYEAIAVSIGAKAFHNETTLHLAGRGAENKILGVLFGSEQQNFENWISQRHTAPKTTSDIQYRGALKGAAKSFFSGLVAIAKEAQQSDAYQSSKTLLLSREARADAIPNLEILADDVKCSHGAAAGPVDEEQKFYLQTRGVPPEEAEEIIIQGFFEPVIAELPSATMQNQLRSFIEEKIKKV